MLRPPPMEGFKAIILDSGQPGGAATLPIRIWSGREIRVFDFEFPTARTQSAQVDGAIEPLYQIYLQTDVIVFPADHRAPTEATYVWERETFAVAESRNDAKFEESPGYFVPPELEKRILHFFQDVLHVDTRKAKVLPYSEERATVGKRLSRHPLHDTFIGKEARRTREQFYSKSSPGMLIPDIQEHTDQATRKSASTAHAMLRVQRVFTMPLKDLLAMWQEAARRLVR